MTQRHQLFPKHPSPWVEHSATCWSSRCYTPYNFQVAVQVHGDSCNNPMVSETKGTLEVFKFSPLAWKMVTSALRLTWSGKETDQPVEYVLLQNWEENHLVLSSGLDGGLPVKERDQVRGGDRGTLSSCSITSPWQRGKLPDGHVLALTRQKLILFLLKEVGATSREGNIGFLGLKTMKKSQVISRKVAPKWQQ